MKYYAVVIGSQPGIYTDWPTTQKNISGFPGALYKSFTTLAEAEAFIRNSTIGPTSTDPPITTSLPDKTVIYTDGSFKDTSCGFGIVLLASNGDKYTVYGRVPLSPSNNVAELYAIYVALSLAQGDIILYTDSRYAVSCLTTYIHDWMIKGWIGVANADLIRSTYEQMKGRSVDLRYVPGHSGYELNEECDRLAETGRIQLEPLVIFKNGIRQ
jgi:ribonuclease HI